MLVRHSIIYFVGKVAPAVITIVSMMLYTRLTSPDEYGVYSLIIVISGLLNILLFQWIRSGLMRFYNDKKNIPEFMNTILYSYIITLVILTIPITITAVIFHFKKINLGYIIIIYIITLLISLYELMIIYFRVNLKPTIITKNEIIKAILMVFISALLLYLGLGKWGLLTGSILSTFIGIIIFKYRIKGKRISLKNNIKTQKMLFSYGLPITLSFSLSVLLQNIDKIMISSMLGFEANGNYSVSFDLMHNLVYMIMTSFSLAGFPIILKRIKEKGAFEGKKEFYRYIEILLFISIPASIGLMSVTTEVSQVVIGQEYRISNNLMYFIIIAALFHGLKSYVFDLGLQISSKTKYFFYPTLLAVLINIVLNYLLLKKYGINGAALATALAFFLSMLLSAFYSKRSYKYKFPYTTLLKIVTASTVMYLLLNHLIIGFNLVVINLVIKVFLGIIIYIFISFILNILNIREIFIKKVFKEHQ